MSIYKYEHENEQTISGHNNVLNEASMKSLLELLDYDIKNEDGVIDTQKVIQVAYSEFGFLVYDDVNDTGGVLVFQGGEFC